jgi:putative ABC transport system permease protein
VQMLDTGLRATLVATGQPDNILVTRRGANAEISSGIDRVQANIIESQPEIATGADGRRLVSKESVILITLPKRESGQATNVTTRGIGDDAYKLRPQVKLVQGRAFEAGAAEAVVGKSLAARFEGTSVGSILRFGGREWRVVGIFDSGGAAFDSEVWVDADQLMQAFRRQAYSSVIARLTDSAQFDALKARLEADPRVTLDVKRERVFYEEQSQALSKFISYLGLTLSIIFSLGAMIGATITMHAAVSNRIGEIGTLRALGFRRSAVLSAFLFESILLGAIGGAVGVALASVMQLVQISTLNWQSFAELAFTFTLTPRIIVVSFVFAVVMGVIGGFLPAVRAARLKIVDALRAA